ncbi:MAG TPA: hypothetical protein VFF79_20290 [Conexibacter sp.]|jgi:hypothetical protein|nr:hypothetical protein [Conexibacter sp.]
MAAGVECDDLDAAGAGRDRNRRVEPQIAWTVVVGPPASTLAVGRVVGAPVQRKR